MKKVSNTLNLRTQQINENNRSNTYANTALTVTDETQSKSVDNLRAVKNFTAAHKNHNKRELIMEIKLGAASSSSFKAIGIRTAVFISRLDPITKAEDIVRSLREKINLKMSLALEGKQNITHMPPFT